MQSPKEYLKKLKEEENMVEVEDLEVLNVLKKIVIYKEIIEYHASVKDSHESRRDKFLNQLLNDLISEMSTTPQSETVVAELLLREINARVIDLERETKGKYYGYVIALNRGLLTFFYSLTKLILCRAAVFPGLEKDPSLKSPIRPILSSDSVESLIKRLIDIYLRGGIPELPPGEVIIKDERLYLLGSLYLYAAMFVLSHELAHLLLNHLEVTHTKTQEFEADEAGFAILLNYLYAKKDDFEIMKAIASVQITFLYLNFIEKIGRFKSGTHPPAEKRMYQLREKNRFPKIYYEMFDAISTLSRKILKI